MTARRAARIPANAPAKAGATLSPGLALCPAAVRLIRPAGVEARAVPAARPVQVAWAVPAARPVRGAWVVLGVWEETAAFSMVGFLWIHASETHPWIREMMEEAAVGAELEARAGLGVEAAGACSARVHAKNPMV